MRIKWIHASNARRFTELIIKDIPHTARLVVLVGQNGSGKSSIFDIFRLWQSSRVDPTFHTKDRADTSQTQIEFYTNPATNLTNSSAKRKVFYLRTAYRNEAEFAISTFQRVGDALSERRPDRTIDNDATVSNNFQRMVSASVTGLFDESNSQETCEELRKNLLGRIHTSMSAVFTDLTMNGIIHPFEKGTFTFNKGTSKDFSYKNLSGGEKAAFDLLLDMSIKSADFDDTVFCIDEPEAHMHTKLQSKLLNELIKMLPNESQLWIATHSIGMMRHAMEMYCNEPGSVAFLDFHDVNFDNRIVLSPVVPDRVFWKKVLSVALDDLSELIMPRQIVLCEGNPMRSPNKSGFDAECYGTIFSIAYPDVEFVSAGNANQVQADSIAIGLTVSNLAKGVTVTRLIDRDDRSPKEISDLEKAGVKVLSRRHIESYLWDEEVLTKLCETEGKPQLVSDTLNALQSAIGVCVATQGKPPDDIKSATGRAFVEIKKLLQLSNCGNTADAFMRDKLAPLVMPGMAVYDQLKKDIFG